MTKYREDLEIDLKDLILFILKKWKMLLMAVVIGSLLGGVYGAIVAQRPAVHPDTTTDIAVLANNLSPKERMDVNIAFRAYQQCLDVYEMLDEMQDQGDINAKIELVKATQQLLNIYVDFSDGQKAYYVSLFNEDNLDNKLIDLKPANIDNNISKERLFKYVLMGAILGEFILVFAFALNYFLTPKLRVVDDLRTAFHLSVIGITESKNFKSDFLSRCIYARAKKADAKKIFLISSSDDEIINKGMDTICTQLDGTDIILNARNCIISDSEVINAIFESDGVVLLEGIGRSLYDDIDREVELCKIVGVPILGVVVIR